MAEKFCGSVMPNPAPTYGVNPFHGMHSFSDVSKLNCLSVIPYVPDISCESHEKSSSVIRPPAVKATGEEPSVHAVIVASACPRVHRTGRLWTSFVGIVELSYISKSDI